jgi:crotonobetainyl-CoA:carnitine CoA-transferase CaiB-like acyl-CoA transferase
MTNGRQTRDEGRATAGDPFAGLLVVEIASTVRGAYCGKLLAELGADVIKVELPDTEPADDGERLWLDAAKRSVVLDWRAPAATGLVRRLLARADVLVEDQPPGTLAAHGLSPKRLTAENARLVYTTIADLGADGPWAGRPATDLIVAALCGIAAINGDHGRTPLREPGEQTRIVAALFGFLGTVTALINRGVTGRGQCVEASGLESMINVLLPSFMQASYQGAVTRRRPAGLDSLFECADGYLSLIPYAERTWDTLVALLGLEIDPDDARFATDAARRQNLPALKAVLAPAMRGRTRADLFEELCAARVVCGMVMRPDEVATDPHYRARGSIVRGVDRQGGERVLPGPGFRVVGRPLPRQAALPDRGAGIDTLLNRAGLIAAEAGGAEGG